MKTFIKKAFEVSLVSAMWMVIGSVIGYYFSITVTKHVTMTSKEAYQKGYEDAAVDCGVIIQAMANQNQNRCTY